MSQKLLIVCNDLNFFLLHRLPEAQGALKKGYEVHIAAPPSPNSSKVNQLGFIHHDLLFSRSGLNPFREIISIVSFYRLFCQIRPNIVYLMTVKPILYGGIAARFARIDKVVVAFFGMGYVFTNNKFSTLILRFIILKFYKYSLNQRNIRVIFQNPVDQNLMVKLRIVDKKNAILIKGSGISLEDFSYKQEPEGVPVVLMAARLLYDKGVMEYYRAAKKIQESGIEARFLLAGERDSGNPSSINHDDFEELRLSPYIELVGFCTNISELISNVNIVVLPSYREGFPRILEEAAACGRPIITTDVPGCRDAIMPNHTGILVPAKNHFLLANALMQLIENKVLRYKMGIAGRKLAEQQYSIEIIAAAHLSIYESLNNLKKTHS